MQCAKQLGRYGRKGRFDGQTCWHTTDVTACREGMGGLCFPSGQRESVAMHATCGILCGGSEVLPAVIPLVLNDLLTTAIMVWSSVGLRITDETYLCNVRSW